MRGKKQQKSFFIQAFLGAALQPSLSNAPQEQEAQAKALYC